MVIPCRKKKSPSIVFFPILSPFPRVSEPSSCYFSFSPCSSSAAADAAVLSTLILFHRLHTQTQTMGCVTQTAPRLQKNAKLGFFFVFFFLLRSPSEEWRACGRACALVTARVLPCMLMSSTWRRLLFSAPSLFSRTVPQSHRANKKVRTSKKPSNGILFSGSGEEKGAGKKNCQ